MADGGELDYLNDALEKGLISESEYLSLQNSKEPNSIYRPLSGKISAKATISYDVPKEEFDQFVNYVYDVYEEEGYNKSQVRVAIKKYLRDLNEQYTWGGGDSLDRERVYEYLKNPKQKGIVNPFLANGGMVDLLKEDDYVWNAVGNKLVVNKVTDDEYYFDYFGSISPKPFKKEKVNEYIKTGQWTLKAPKMSDGGMMAQGGRLNVVKKYNTISDYLKDAKRGDLVLIGRDENDLEWIGDSHLNRFVKIDEEGEGIFQIFGRKGLVSFPSNKNVIVVDRKYEDGGMFQEKNIMEMGGKVQYKSHRLNK